MSLFLEYNEAIDFSIAKQKFGSVSGNHLTFFFHHNIAIIKY